VTTIDHSGTLANNRDDAPGGHRPSRSARATPPCLPYVSKALGARASTIVFERESPLSPEDPSPFIPDFERRERDVRRIRVIAMLSGRPAAGEKESDAHFPPTTGFDSPGRAEPRFTVGETLIQRDTAPSLATASLDYQSRTAGRAPMRTSVPLATPHTFPPPIRSARADLLRFRTSLTQVPRALIILKAEISQQVTTARL
jgi:hypothetical protein